MPQAQENPVLADKKVIRCWRDTSQQCIKSSEVSGMKSIFGLILGACLAMTAHAAGVAPLRVGILPTLSAKALITAYQPLRIYLEREFQRPVELITSPDFKRFHQDTKAGDFDLLVSAPHLARLAQLESGFLPLASYVIINRPILITAKNKPVKKIEELRGHNLAIFDPLALVVLQAQHWLEDQGLKAGRDYRVMVSPSQTSVAHSVQIGESLIGVVAPSAMKQFPAEVLEQIQVFNELAPVPSLIWIAHPRMAAQADRLKTALLRFPETPEGAQFAGNTIYKGLRPVSPEELRGLDRAAREVGKLIQAQP
jgi:phosphonate transport system substrate-binding protein